jgi:hypothetical protein
MQFAGCCVAGFDVVWVCVCERERERNTDLLPLREESKPIVVHTNMAIFSEMSILSFSQIIHSNSFLVPGIHLLETGEGHL